MSGLFGALSCLMVFLCLRELRIRTHFAVAASWALGASQLFWAVSRVAEVYTLHTFFLGLLFWLGLRYRTHTKTLDRNLIFLVLGLSLSTHATSTLLTLPALCLLLYLPLRREGWRSWMRGLPMTILGLLPYFYLPLRSMAGAGIDKWLLYYPFQGSSDWLPAHSLRFIQYFCVEILGRDFAWIGTPLAFWGFMSYWSRQKAVVLAALLGWIGLTLPILAFARISWSGPLVASLMMTFAPASLFMALLVGLGLETVSERVARAMDRLRVPG